MLRVLFRSGLHEEASATPSRASSGSGHYSFVDLCPHAHTIKGTSLIRGGRPEKEEGERSAHMRIAVDLTRCQSYGQCVFAAPSVLRFHGEEALEYDYTPDDQLREQVRWAAGACPVHAITLDYLDEQPEKASQPESVGGKA